MANLYLALLMDNDILLTDDSFDKKISLEFKRMCFYYKVGQLTCDKNEFFSAKYRDNVITKNGHSWNY